MTKFKNKFRKFSNDQESHVQKSLDAITVAECMSFIEDSLQSSDEVTLFVK